MINVNLFLDNDVVPPLTLTLSTLAFTPPVDIIEDVVFFSPPVRRNGSSIVNARC